MPEFKLEVGAAMPGEALLTKLFDVNSKYRETMSQENRDKFDAVLIAMLRGWHNFWVGLGWPGEKV